MQLRHRMQFRDTSDAPSPTADQASASNSSMHPTSWTQPETTRRHVRRPILLSFTPINWWRRPSGRNSRFVGLFTLGGFQGSEPATCEFLKRIFPTHILRRMFPKAASGQAVDLAKEVRRLAQVVDEPPSSPIDRVALYQARCQLDALTADIPGALTGKRLDVYLRALMERNAPSMSLE